MEYLYLFMERKILLAIAASFIYYDLLEEKFAIVFKLIAFLA